MLFLPCLIDLLDVLLVIGVNHISLLKNFLSSLSCGHPVLAGMMDNIYVRTDPAGNIKPDKEKSTEKIDGAVALIMALDRAIRNQGEDFNSVYNERGLLIL